MSDKSDVTTLCEPPALAHQAAEANLRANLDAFAARGEAVVAPPLPDELELLYARDGALTGMHSNGRWWRGCSVPLRAAQIQLKSLNVTGRCACLLDPGHAAVVRAALERLRADQAVIVAMPGADELALLLRCENFAEEIGRNRLFVATGDSWPEALEAIFHQRPGLPSPSQFIRLAWSDPAIIEQMIAAAQGALSRVETSRREVMTRLSARCPARSGGLCVVGPQRFRLWQDAGAVLAEVAAEGGDRRVVDLDNPTQAGTLALAQAAAECRAVVAADGFRADAQAAVHSEVPWITWVTRPVIPPYASAGPRDGILLADPAWLPLAASAGWPADRTRVAGWPRWPSATGTPKTVSLAADVQPLEAPAELHELSSLRLAWESLAEQILRDPLTAFDRGAELVARACRDLNVDQSIVPAPLFFDHLIPVAYAVGLARLLSRNQIPIRLLGEGWRNYADLAPYAAGPMLSRSALYRDPTIWMHPAPCAGAHPVDGTTHPIIRFAGGGQPALLKAVRDALTGRNHGGITLIPALTRAAIERLLG